jgi:uncharacterized membrane protein YphA (DoxX/SURF4 family)
MPQKVMIDCDVGVNNFSPYTVRLAYNDFFNIETYFAGPVQLLEGNIFVDPKEMIQFMKNVSMFGGCLILLASGAGRFSLDSLLRSKKK